MIIHTYQEYQNYPPASTAAWKARNKLFQVLKVSSCEARKLYPTKLYDITFWEMKVFQDKQN